MTDYHKTIYHAVVLCGLAFSGLAFAHEKEMQQIPLSVQVSGELAPATISDLKFHDFFKMPIGPRGLELSDKLLSLNGKKVRILGYMANVESPTPGIFVLSPLPVELGDADESLSDDLPPSSLFVHTGLDNLVVPHIPTLIKLTGILRVGNREEADGHVSIVQLELDPAITADIIHMLSKKQAAK